MSTETTDDNVVQQSPQIHETHVHNVVRLGNERGWKVLITFLLVAGITMIGYQLSLGPLADVVATAISMFTMTLVSYMFRAGILRLPEAEGDAVDDLAFTKSTLRRIYDEVTTAIVNSSVLRLVLFAAAQTAAFLAFKAAVAFGLGLMTSVWMAGGVGLIFSALIVAQEEIWAWLRKAKTKNGGSR